MITKENNAKLNQSKEFTSYSFGIKESGLSHIFNVLRNQLYSDKILAVIREYSANALDAHAEVGKQNTPIEVTVPSELNLNFEVRDFGRGLSEREIGEIYAMYGESTKRSTNEQVGQLGLGSKSGFAYGDNFLITSWNKGKKVVYNAFIDPSQIGRIAKMQEEESDEPCGIKITVPVKQKDVHFFKHKALDLFSLFKVTPDIKGVSEIELKESFSKNESLFEAEDKSWKIFNRSYNSKFYAVMGNISYPIDADSLNLQYGEDLYKLLNYVMGMINVPIGSLEVAANREGLQYTDSTINEIKAKLKAIIEELPNLIHKRIASAETLWEAKKIYAAAKISALPATSRFIKTILEGKKIEWKGIPVESNLFSFRKCKYAKDVFGFKCEIFGKTSKLNPSRNAKSKRIKKQYNTEILNSLKDKILIIEDDTNKSSGKMNRIAPLLTEYEGRPNDIPLYDFVYLIKWGEKKDEIIKDLHFDAETKLLSSFEHVPYSKIYPVDKKSVSSSASPNRKKHQSKEFKLNLDCKSNYSAARSTWFDQIYVDTENATDAVYVCLDRFYIKNINDQFQDLEPRSVVHLVKKVHSLTGCNLPEVHAFKDDTKVKNKDNWTDLFSWLANTLKQYFIDSKLDQMVCDYYHLEKHIKNVDKLHFKIVKSYFSDQQPKLKLSSPSSLMKKYINAVKDMSLARNEDNLNLLEQLGKITRNSNGFSYDKIPLKLCFDNKPSHDLNNLAKECIELYPMTAILNYWNEKEILLKNISEYVNLVDITCRNK